MIMIEDGKKVLINCIETLHEQHSDYYSKLVDDINNYNSTETFNDIDDFILKFYKSNKRHFFTICSKESFSNFEVQTNYISFIYTPLNDHSRPYMHKGDIVFCYRIGQFESLDEALDIRGIYGVGIVMSEPEILFPDLDKHNKYGVAIFIPKNMKKHLKLRNIQLNPNTINLTPYNGNRNDALQYIQDQKHYMTLLSMVCKGNPDIKAFYEKYICSELSNSLLPEDEWKRLNSTTDINDKKKFEYDEIKLPTVAKECARQIVRTIYDFDKFENLKSLFRMNTNIKIDTSELGSDNVLYNVFYTADSSQYENDGRTFLTEEYNFSINDLKVTCRLTNQWCGFGEGDDEAKTKSNWLWALCNIVNKHYEGIFEIIDYGPNAKLLCYKQTDNKYSLIFKTTFTYLKPRNRILFGAPGTGKSFKLNQEAIQLVGATVHDGFDTPDSNYYERVTFHPNYTYSQFVGTYKPITKNTNEENISYEYIAGPFIRLLIKALKNARKPSEIKPYLLLIEEINRANVAAVFGDIFQLLDRNSDGVSEYEIETSEDLRKFLAKNENLGGKAEDYKKIKIPNNMFIWATMNSADQGVLPMDAAFKRRWEFEYINIDDGESALDGVKIPIPFVKKSNEGKEETIYIDVEWNELRKAINNQLKTISGVNEDKLLGPFFIGDKSKIENAVQDKEQFCKSFKSKVLMYLYEDVVKMQPGELFDSKEGINIHYSDICKDFDSKGLRIFVKSVYEPFSEFANGDSE